MLVSHWDRVADWVGGAEGMLLRYIVRTPNPLSVLGTCLLVMRAEIASEHLTHSTALQVRRGEEAGGG